MEAGSTPASGTDGSRSGLDGQASGAKAPKPPRNFRLVYVERKADTLAFPVVTKVTREERQAFARRATSLGRGIAEHMRALLRQDLTQASAEPPTLPESVPLTPLAPHRRPTVSAEARFWAKVERRGPDECWEWKAARSKTNYGLSSGFGTTAAHRIAWVLANGSEIPTGMVIMHTCDHPPCCNPAHLRPGTYAQNATDKAAKGRGRQEGRSRLTFDQAMAYRERVLAGDMTMSEVARLVGVTVTTVSKLLHGRTHTDDMRLLPQDVPMPRRVPRSAICQAIEAVLSVTGGLRIEELCQRLSEKLSGPLKMSVAVVYLKKMRHTGEVLFTGKRGGIRTGMRGGQRADTRYYLKGTVPDGVFVRPHRKA